MSGSTEGDQRHGYRIALARPQDLALLPHVELAAARLLDGHAPESVLNEPTSDADFLEAQRRGHLWVALTGDVAVGFAHVTLLESVAAHLNELDVHPSHGRRGLGTRLVMQACDWAAANGYESVTLSTFREVAWNMPFYARLGFTVISADALSPALRSIVAHEGRQGLDTDRRVVMRRLCRPERSEGIVLERSVSEGTLGVRGA
ncbi:MAG: GNAT family N-acetyltransferase [bacterium]